MQDVHAELKNGKYELVNFSSDAVCLQRIGNVCWTYSSKYALGYLFKYSLALVIIIGLLSVGLLGFYLKYLHEKNREQKKHRLALQVLSHEFRTPVSALVLMIDQLTKRQFLKQELHHQDLVTRISAEVFRLQRIIEVSKNYLQAESRRIPFKYVEIPSINEWVSDFVGESNLDVQCEPLAIDQALRADPYWLKFVLSTLVQNAFAHGQQPVRIRLSRSGGGVQITVVDQGSCEFNSLNQMTDAFVKSSRSQGMGLGLNIAQFIVSEWGGEIQFSKSPTAFTLSLSHRNAHA